MKDNNNPSGEQKEEILSRSDENLIFAQLGNAAIYLENTGLPLLAGRVRGAMSEISKLYAEIDRMKSPKEGERLKSKEEDRIQELEWEVEYWKLKANSAQTDLVHRIQGAVTVHDGEAAAAQFKESSLPAIEQWDKDSTAELNKCFGFASAEEAQAFKRGWLLCIGFGIEWLNNQREQHPVQQPVTDIHEGEKKNDPTVYILQCPKCKSKDEYPTIFTQACTDCVKVIWAEDWIIITDGKSE